MTAQISDTFLYNAEEYVLIGITGTPLPTPKQFGMKPEMMHTACYRGFYATYELTEEVLYLQEMTVREKNGNYLPINGVEPAKDDFDIVYNRINLLVPFTGQLRLAKDFIAEHYVHMGFQKASAFKVVIDFALDNGKLLFIEDRSQEMKEIRGAFKKRYESGDMLQTIEDAFSLDMDLE